MTGHHEEVPLPFVVGLLLLLMRGLLLWIVIPATVCFWLLAIIPLRRRGIRFGQLLGWVDYNLMVLLQRSIFRPFVRQRPSYIAPREMSSVTHRVRFTDPY